MDISTTRGEAWITILSFLELKDFFQLSQTCKAMYNKIKAQQRLAAIRYQTSIAQKQDGNLSSVYRSSKYIKLLQNDGYTFLTNQSLSLIKEYQNAKIFFARDLKHMCGEEKTKRLIDSLDKALTQPTIVPLSLQRDYHRCEAFSSYQTLLSDSYYGFDEEGNLNESRMIGEQEVFEFGFLQDEEINCFDHNQKSSLMSARWYNSNLPESECENSKNSMCETAKQNKEKKLQRRLTKTIAKIKARPSSKQNQKQIFNSKLASYNISCYKKTFQKTQGERKSTLVQIFQHLDRIFTTYCRMLYDLLEKFRSPILFISEYTTKWKNFVASMRLLGRLLGGYSRTMNQVYEETFKGYPNYPEFKIWRMMSRIWYTEIYSRLEQMIITNFTTVLDKYLNQRYNLENEWEEIFGVKQNTPDSFLNTELLSDFWNSILDISLNERKIFNLTCSDLKCIGVSSKFCNSVLDFINNKSKSVIQESSISHIKKFQLLADIIEEMGAIIPHHVFPEIYETMIKYLKANLSAFISESLPFFDIQKALQLDMDSWEKFYTYLRYQESEEIYFDYSTLKQQLQYCHKKIRFADSIKVERERRATENIKKGFNLFACELEKTFFDLDRHVSSEILEQCRAIHLN